MRTVVEGLAFAEGPRWRDGRLWWSDMHAGRVQSWAQGEAPRMEAEVAARPSGLGWLPDRRLLIVSMLDRRILRREPDGSLAVHADLAGLIPERPNDMVVDARGGAYVGNFGFDLERGAAPVPTVLVRVEADGRAGVVADEVMFPNGMVITPDGRTLIVAETFAARLTAFDIGANGDLSHRRVWASLPQGHVPDGVCLDAEGAVWVASPTGKACLRMREGGEVAAAIEPGRGVYACTLGGADGRTLYLCTGDDHDPVKRREQMTGRIEAVKVEIAGAGSP